MNFAHNPSLLYEIIAGLRTVGTDVASSSSAPPGISTTKSVSELLTDVAPVASDSMINEANALVGDDPSEMQEWKEQKKAKSWNAIFLPIFTPFSFLLPLSPLALPPLATAPPASPAPIILYSPFPTIPPCWPA
ncbi:hypothetical protein CsSME_00031260 [Camellia sinensis var. sinensis]